VNQLGAEINLTIAISADRTGQYYDAAVMPNVVVDGDITQVHGQAIEWIRTCQGK
jgi:hypothetical protein